MYSSWMSRSVTCGRSTVWKGFLKVFASSVMSVRSAKSWRLVLDIRA